MPDVFRIADILVEHAVRVHGHEISLIVYGGSYAKGTASPTSDLDIYYIPDDGKASSLASTFVLDGLPYDFWGVPWRFAEDIANARSRRPWAVSASLIADTKVLHHRSEEDLDRFNALKDRIAELTRPESRGYMVGRALEEHMTALSLLGQMRLAAHRGDQAGLRWAGWSFACRTVNCLALINQTYFSKGWGANMPQILAMPQQPEGLADMLQGTMMPAQSARSASPEFVHEQADRLAGSVRETLLAAQESVGETTGAKDVFSDFYYYVVEYAAKVRSACDRGDAVAARGAALYLQELISRLMNKVDVGFYGAGFNLLGEYSGGYERAGFPDLLEPAWHGDLSELADRAERLDAAIREWFSSHAIGLNELADEDDLRRFLNERGAA